MGLFQSLGDRLNHIFSKLTKHGKLTELEIKQAMREVRIALLEADVNFMVVKDFVNKVSEKAVGEEILKSLTPGQQVIKIVRDELVSLMGETNAKLGVSSNPPTVMLMCGLQGAGKTTMCSKLGLMLKKQGKKPLLVACDIYRPAAIEQLRIGAKNAGVDFFEKGTINPVKIANEAIKQAEKMGNDVVIIDTAGRLQINEELMKELAEIKKATKPTEILLTIDAMTGQESVNVAKEFNEKLGVSGIVLTRIDGSSRAGAALSMRMIAGVPIKFLGTGEKIDEFEEFHPDRIAGRILGQGDVISLVETAMEKIDREEADKMAQQMMKGKFDLNDLLAQIRQIQKLGSLGGIMSMIQGLSKFKNQIENAGIGDDLIKKQEAIILSMTLKERKNPDLIKASRKKRIAAGAGVEVHEVNKLLKQYEQMASMMKKFGQGGGMSGLASMMKRFPGGKFPMGMGNKFPF